MDEDDENDEDQDPMNPHLEAEWEDPLAPDDEDRDGLPDDEEDDSGY